MLRVSRICSHACPHQGQPLDLAARPSLLQTSLASSNQEEASPPVLYEVKGNVAIITLNRATNRNAMTVELLEGVRDAISRAASDQEARCVVLVGQGRNFCGGADFRGRNKPAYVDHHISAGPLVAGEKGLAMYNHFLALMDLPIPVVGALQGHAIGGGLGLALCCDIRVCHAGSQYGANFVRLGLHPGMATTYFLPRLVGVPRAVELLLTGRLVDGTEAHHMGLASDVGSTPEEVFAKAMALADQIAANAPVAVRWTKRSIYRHLEWNPRGAAWDEANLQGRTSEMQDSREGVKALLEKRKPLFTGE